MEASSYQQLSVFTKEDKTSAPLLEESPYPDIVNFEVHVKEVQKLAES